VENLKLPRHSLGPIWLGVLTDIRLFVSGILLESCRKSIETVVKSIVVLDALLLQGGYFMRERLVTFIHVNVDLGHLVV
jgi:hypothetical protein